ncbi:hypothetical protein Ctha_2455 [Chloroherpeton thalassium ATCC 35110]|uniref:Uncharacterized protein n=1 Tax=Chloroherpeton thalassium (strain ATCC 35110 / GB-78) TaxID=517418 RepID=B3QXI9_CHLT3|nr:hypothetical protein [Chloroherpeton thalassium]ACF14904.1 hypothetical protein Ctha_2455 [Chloroherpeton thalassium ATCC 35110]
MATIAQKTSNADGGFEKRAELIAKIMENSAAIQSALSRNAQNVYLQTLDKEAKLIGDYINSSSISNDRVEDFLNVLSEVIQSAQQPAVVKPESETPKPQPVATPQPAPEPAPVAEDFLAEEESNTDNLLGLDLEGILGDVLSDGSHASSVFSTDQDDVIFRVDGDKIVLKADDELEKGLDEEAKMFELEQFFKNKEYLKALTVALALNIRFKQGVGKRSDAIVRRQDEVIFHSNYMIARDYLGKIKNSKGDQKVENQLLAIMHLYAALDQNPLPGQEKYRTEMKSVIEKMVERERTGSQAYIKAGFFKKINVPSPEDKASKSLYWKDKANEEPDVLKKEFYLLMTFASDLTYYPYQIALANFYVDTDRLDEACRYIQVPLPLIKENGLDFMLKLKQKNPEYADKFIERRVISDINQLKTKLEQPDPKELEERDPEKREKMEKLRFKKFLEMIDMWQKQLDAMKTDVLYKSSNLRLEYTKAFVDLVNYARQNNPNAILEDYIARYGSTDVKSIQNPNILNYIDFCFRYSIVPDEKSLGGLAVEGEAEEKLESLGNSIVEYFNLHVGISNKDKSAAKTKVDLDTEHLAKSMQEMGYNFYSVPVLSHQ